MKEIETEVLASPVTLQTQLTCNFLSKSPNNYPTQMAQSLSAQTLWATRDTGLSLFTDFHRRAQRNTLRKEESSRVKPYVPVYIVVGAAVWAVVPSVAVISSCRLPDDLAFDVKYQPAGLAPSQVVGWTQTMNQPKRGENRVNTAVSPMRGWRLEGRGGGRKGLAGRFTEAMPYDFAQFAYLLCFPPSLSLAEYLFHTAVLCFQAVAWLPWWELVRMLPSSVTT